MGLIACTWSALIVAVGEADVYISFPSTWKSERKDNQLLQFLLLLLLPAFFNSLFPTGSSIVGGFMDSKTQYIISCLNLLRYSTLSHGIHPRRLMAGIQHKVNSTVYDMISRGESFLPASSPFFWDVVGTFLDPPCLFRHKFLTYPSQHWQYIQG